MSKGKILYISQEITPYLPANIVSTLGQKLPQSLQEHGYEVRTFMPKYGCINERRNQLHEVIRLSGMNLIIDDTDHPLIIKVATLQPSRMQVYFIDSDDYFVSHASSDLEIHTSPEDNDERIMFFARGVIETVKKLRWEPALIHCTGWVTALAPLYIKSRYNDDPSFRNAKIVYTIIDDSFEGSLDARMYEKLKMDGLTDAQLAAIADGPVNAVTLKKLAIDHADAIVISSDNIPQELIDYAHATGKPVLEAPTDGDDFVDLHAQFYESLLND